MRHETVRPGSSWRGNRAAGVTVRLLAGMLLALLLGSAGSKAAPPTVNDIRIRAHGEATRVVLDLSSKVSYRHLTLDGPARLAIDLPEVDLAHPEDLASGPQGMVENLRFGRLRPGVSRLVLDVSGPFEILNVFELPPNQQYGHRIVTDLRGVEAGQWQAGDGLAGGIERAALLQGITPDAGPEDRTGSAQQIALAVPLRMPPKLKPRADAAVRQIVIDPGHGGIDPGAIGVSGVYEKTIVLDIAQALRRQLLATGRYKVVMTRDDDSTVRLRERLEVARELGGDLFLSLHADSLVQAPGVRGAAVYTLSEEASSAEAARLASKENRADILNGIDLSHQEDIVTQILIDLAQRDANNKSIRMAEVLVDELSAVTPLARRKRQSAGFVVLKSPEMPSALLELGYLSNEADERRLTDQAQIEKLAAAIVRGIDRFFHVGAF